VGARGGRPRERENFLEREGEKICESSREAGREGGKDGGTEGAARDRQAGKHARRQIIQKRALNKRRERGRGRIPDGRRQGFL